MISAEARCSLLATRMQQVWQLDASFTPPAPAPLLPEGALPPPPTPSPPRPRLPVSESARIVHAEPTRVTLSTYFLGEAETDPDTASTALGNVMALTNVANATRKAALDAITSGTNGLLPLTAWAACSAQLSDAPLPCRTGDTPARCLDGGRRCGDVESNTERPWLELDLTDDRIATGDHYFFGLEFSLPANPEFASLFFESSTHQGARAIGDVTNKYYELEVFDAAHNPLPVQCKPYHRQSIDVYKDGLTAFQYVCLEALATDAEYAALRHVHYVRFTLLGEYRMLWIEGVRVEWRELRDLPPAPPPRPARRPRRRGPWRRPTRPPPTRCTPAPRTRSSSSPAASTPWPSTSRAASRPTRAARSPTSTTTPPCTRSAPPAAARSTTCPTPPTAPASRPARPSRRTPPRASLAPPSRACAPWRFRTTHALGGHHEPAQGARRVDAVMVVS